MTESYQVLPPLTAEEYEALKADIAEHGVLVPIELDEQGTVLDGHHRLKACQELGVTDYPRLIRPGLSESEKRLHALRLNLTRRHLSQEQRRELARQQIKETLRFSNRRLASLLGVSHPTVAILRYELEQSGEVERFTTTTGTDGKEYPRVEQENAEIPCWHDAVMEALHTIIHAACDTLRERLATAHDIPSLLAIYQAAEAVHALAVKSHVRVERVLGKLLLSRSDSVTMRLSGLDERQSAAVDQICRLVWPQVDWNARAGGDPAAFATAQERLGLVTQEDVA